ncbi:acyltransferase [Gammaproteobacteria bacterium]|nr:acyltransferase [Gammaproteobacteria bacterium]
MPTGTVSSTTEKHLPHPSYRPDIDGLRAIAILSVTGFHYFPTWFNGGFIGVDIFFVISGFLISSILFKSFESSTFSYREFYYRRIRRIFPALLLVLTFTAVTGWFILYLHEFQQLGKHLVGGIAFVSNLILWVEHGYFDNLANSKPLLHLWSLGVEEQFYIIWPLLLAAIWKRKFNFLKASLVIALVSFLINIVTVNDFPVSNFYSPLGRFWELMLGGILAYTLSHRMYTTTRHHAFIPALGIFFIVLGIVLINRQSAFPGWWALLPACGAFCIIYAHPDNWINKYVLGNRVMVWFGLISYPLYLWHWPLLSFLYIAEGEQPQITARMVSLSASILLAWLTYEIIEKKARHSTRRITIYLIGLATVFLLFTGSIIWSGVVLPRNSIPAIESAMTDWQHPDGLTKIKIDGRKFYEKQTGPTKVLFLGDSLLEQYSPRIVKVLNDHPTTSKSVIFATAGGCPPVPNVYEDKHQDCRGLIDSAIRYADLQQVDTIVIGAYWDGYFIHHTKASSSGDYRYYHLKDHNKSYFVDGDGAQRALEELEHFLSSLARNKKVFLILSSPSGKQFHPKNHTVGTRLSGTTFTGGRLVSVSEEQETLRNKLIALSRRSRVTLIDPLSSLCENNQCPTALSDGTLLYKDNSHMRPFHVKDSAGFMDITVVGR